VVARHGAHVLSWIPEDGAERLFLSERALFDSRSPIRGGIPVCFPQFSGLGTLPKHGLVRTRAWDLGGMDAGNGVARLDLHTMDDESTRALWPHPYQLGLQVVLAPARLEVELQVRNTGGAPLSFTGALHTYFAVGDIAAASLFGLSGVEYRDAANGDAIRVDEAEPLVVGAEVDRVYHDAPAELMLRDGTRRLAVASAGFVDAVVWNPWAILCASLPDMAPEGYRKMLCIEAAAARRHVTVAAGAEWRGRQTLHALQGSGG
jgi:glucose-6-phosphate 1-epimerase